MEKKIKSYRILNLEGSWFDYNVLEKNEYKFTFSSTENKVFKNKEGKTITIKPNKDKLFSATMPYSLETDRAFTKYPSEVLNADLEIADEDYINDTYKMNIIDYTGSKKDIIEILKEEDKYLLADKNAKNELFTKLFVNFKFTKDLFEDDTEDIEESELKKEINDNEDDIKESEENKPIKSKRIKKKKLRKLIYTSTVEIDGIEYRFFKRGASKARTANVIFCKADMWDSLLTPSLLGLKFKEGELYDLTSKEAYTSLIMSGIIGKINIPSDQILIINDLMSTSFPVEQTKTIMNNDGTVEQKEDIYYISNNMTDGEGLMDESIYLKNKFLNESTCALLRNDFLKCNAVRTKLQEYYKELFKKDYETAEVFDMYRGWIPAKNIRLVITASSCKYLKFADQYNSETECYLDWLDKIPSDFGVVKTDHVGNYEFSNRLSYQMINSMNLSSSEVSELMQDELDYFKLLKDNTYVTSEELRKFNAELKKFNRAERNEMSYFLKYINDNNNEDIDLETSDMISALLNKNNDFRFTKKFKDWKNEQLQNYIKILRLGKIRIQNSLYAIMVSCPYEMLVATTKEKNKIDSCIMTGWECFNPHYPENTEFLAIRNPQINEGNVAHMTNKYHEEYKWFGYQVEENGEMKHKHEFVVFVNTWDTDIMNRLQGCDFDIDTCYLSDFPLLVSKAKEAQKYYTPTNGIEGDKSKKEYSEKSLSELDNYLGGSTMAIGKVVNKSAIFNAYMYNAINTEEYNEDYINKCFEASSTLSSYSQISIDMAKKSFSDSEGEPLSLTKLMNQLNQKTYKYKTIENGKEVEKEERILKYQIDRENPIKIKLNTYLKELLKQENENHEIQYELVKPVNMDNKLKEYKNDAKTYKKLTLQDKQVIFNKYDVDIEVYARKMIVPKFFKYVAKKNDYRIPTPFECGMDYLEEILDNITTKAMETDVKQIKDLVNPQSSFKGTDYNKNKIDEARKIIDNCKSIMNDNIPQANDNKDEKKRKSNLRKWAKNTAVKQLKELKLNDKTILRIVLRALNIDENYKGNTIKKLNDKEEEIKYIDKKTGKEKILTYREFKEMTMLTLTLMYNCYPKTFIECFKKKKSNVIEVDEFWK